MSSLKHGNCRLCGNKGKILNSHIVPKWVGKWLRDTSATGYLRLTNQPNKRVQDLPTLPLFCHDCEQLIGRDERLFRERMFMPVLEEHREEFPYDEWLLRFAVSLAFRTVTYYQEISPEEHPEREAEIRGALYRWRRFLLRLDDTPGEGGHHMFVADPVVANVRGQRRHTNQYLLRSIHIDVIFRSNGHFAYTKLPWFMFVSQIGPEDITGWHNTRIEKRGVLPYEQHIDSQGFADYLSDKVSQYTQAIGGLSDRQQEAIIRSAIKSPERTYFSQSFDLHRYERELQRLEGDGTPDQ